MRLEVITFKGDLRTVTDTLNKAHAVSTVLQMEKTDTGEGYDVLFRIGDYPAYVHFCQQMGIRPMSTKEYFE